LYLFIFIPKQIVQIILLFLRHSFILKRLNIILKIWKYAGFNASCTVVFVGSVNYLFTPVYMYL
jgi:hypothetical protein